MAELLKEQSETYFNRRTKQVETNRQSIARTVGTDTVISNPAHDIPQERNANVIKTQAKLSLVDKIWFSVCAIISVVILMFALTIRMEIVEIDRSIDQIEDRITEYQTQTEQLRSQIIEQYDYTMIKEAAQNNGMTIDKSRVRTVGE